MEIIRLQSFKKTTVAFVIALLLASSAGCVYMPAMQEKADTAQEAGAEHIMIEPPGELIAFQNYAGLSELITVLCDEAGRQFNGFFGTRVVLVQPFLFLAESGRNRMTVFGAGLADQMVAMINNNAPDPGLAGTYPQAVNGVLQEIDGYLRVHISGVNSAAQRRSYSVNVEMSEAVYRALHSYLDKGAATFEIAAGN